MIEIGVLGAGTMGSGIAQVAAQAGHVVHLVDVNESAVQNAIYYCKNEYPELKLYYNTPVYLKMRTILFDIVLLGIFFLFIIILKKKIN